jgi:hypothetical protein
MKSRFLGLANTDALWKDQGSLAHSRLGRRRRLLRILSPRHSDVFYEGDVISP